MQVKNISSFCLLFMVALLLQPHICHAHNSVSMGYGLLYVFASCAVFLLNFFLIVINIATKRRWLTVVCSIFMIIQLWLIFLYSRTMNNATLLLLSGSLLEGYGIFRSFKKKVNDQ